MNVSGKSASRAPASADLQRRALRACRSWPRGRTATGSACTHATLTTSFTRRAYAFARLGDERVLASYSNFRYSAPRGSTSASRARAWRRSANAPGAAAPRPTSSRAGSRARCSAFAMSIERTASAPTTASGPRRPPRRLSAARTSAKRMAGCLTDPPRDLSHGRRIRIAAVEGARARLSRRAVARARRCSRRGGVEVSVAAIRQSTT